ncbi:MAG: terminase large subunit [Alphaproteobacteria bacterium]
MTETSAAALRAPWQDFLDAGEARAALIEDYARRTAQPGEWFDGFAADAAVAFFEQQLTHTEAEWAGQPFILSPWQRATVRVAWGWKRADGTRRFREIYIEIGRKNGKTEFGAGLILLILLGDAEVGGQVYCTGVNEDQAEIVFKKATVMVSQSPLLRDQLETLTTSIYCASLNAVIKPISSKPGSKHGFSPSGRHSDEIHEYPNGDLVDVIHKGTGARRQPMEVELTTAGVYGRGYGWERHDHALKVWTGEKEDHALLPVIFAADPDDDWTDPATWAKANPNLGISPKWDYMVAECAKAKGNPRKENEFKRFHLNLWTEQAVRWIPLHQWRLNSARPGDDRYWRQLEHKMRGRSCWSGLDLAAVRDTVGLVHCFPPDESLPLWVLLYRCWLPEDSVEDAIETTRMPWRDWARMGALTLTEGNVMDYRVIQEQVKRDRDVFRIQEIAYDPWNSSQLVTELQKDGAPMINHAQTVAAMTGPSKEFERLVFAAQIEHGNHPVARWQMGNVAVYSDGNGNIKPDKQRSGEKIDLSVAAIMAVGRAVLATDGGKSVYDRLAEAKGERPAPVAPAPTSAYDGVVRPAIDFAALNDPDHPGFAAARDAWNHYIATRPDDDE